MIATGSRQIVVNLGGLDPNTFEGWLKPNGEMVDATEHGHATTAAMMTGLKRGEARPALYSSGHVRVVKTGQGMNHQFHAEMQTIDKKGLGLIEPHVHESLDQGGDAIVEQRHPVMKYHVIGSKADWGALKRGVQ